MPAPIGGLNNPNAGGHPVQPVKQFTVELPNAKPSRKEIAEAMFRYFGFGKDDTPSLKKKFNGTDPANYFADTLRYNPRSISTANGKPTMRLELSVADYEVMRKLAAERHPPAASSNKSPGFTSAKEAENAVAASNGIDHAARFRKQLQPQGAPPPAAPPAATKPKSEEGVAAFLDGVARGDFSANDSWSKTGGQIAAGAIPVYGQITDARDTAAAIKDVWQGKEGGGVNLAAATVGWVPVFGDAAKAALKAGRKILVETANEAAARAVRDNAGQLSRIVDPATRRAVEQAIRDEALTKYAAREVEVGKQMDELALHGHGPQRHGSHITEKQLDDRAMYGIDPVSGTTDDAYNKLPDGTPVKHAYGKDATKITSDEAYVEAETYIRNSQALKDAKAAADAAGKLKAVVEGVSLKDIYGASYKDHVFGKTRLGTKNNPVGSVDTDFTDGTITAVYIKDSSGQWNVRTMYPEPKQ